MSVAALWLAFSENSREGKLHIEKISHWLKIGQSFSLSVDLVERQTAGGQTDRGFS